MGRGRQDWDNREETGRGNGEGKMERGQREGGDGRGAKGNGEKKGKEEEAFYRWI